MGEGTNENTNGLLRQYFPKGTHFKALSDAKNRLNERLRKGLGFQTPSEIFHSQKE